MLPDGASVRGARVGREAKGMRASEALKKAQEYVKKQPGWEHPYYWAAWVLWGLPD